jgi:hypothetical protein
MGRQSLASVRIARRPARTAFAALALGAVALGGFACSSDSDDASSSTNTTQAPEDVFAADAEVTAGLTELRTTFQQAHDAIAAKSATVSSFPDKLEKQWFAIEGTIKKNDPLSYITMEDALAQVNNAVKSGTASVAQQAVDKFNTAADTYLAKHP